MSTQGSWSPVWEKIFNESEWGKYPAESLIRFIARNFYHQQRSEIRILEVGCGPGANLWYVSREGFQTYGVDGSATAVDKAKHRLALEGLKADIYVGDVIVLDQFENDYFDAVIDAECVCCNNLINSKKILAEAKRVLKINGLFYSRTFSDKTVVGLDAEYVTPLEVSMATDGPLQGKGFVRLSNEKSINELYGELFCLESIDVIDYTSNNQKIRVSEFIIVGRKCI